MTRQIGKTNEYGWNRLKKITGTEIIPKQEKISRAAVNIVLAQGAIA